MTTTELIEQTSFAYDRQFPPDVAAGLPLSAALRGRPPEQRPPVKRALHGCVRIAHAVAGRR
jgi:hypothetical protein